MRNFAPAVGRVLVSARPPVLLLCAVLALVGCVTETTNLRPPDPVEAARLYTELGFGYVKQKQYEVAEEKFQRARELNAGMVEPVYGLGLVRFAQGRTIEGRNLIDRAAADVGDNTKMRKVIAQWYCEARQPAEAGKLLQLPIDAGDPDAVIRWSECLFRNQRAADADEVILKALRREPNAGQYLLVLANRSAAQQDWLRTKMLLNRYERNVAPTTQSAVIGLRTSIALSDEPQRQRYVALLQKLNPQVLQQIDPNTGELRRDGS